MFQKFKVVLYIGIYLLGLVVLGLLNIAILDWDWDVITWEWFLELNLYNVLYFSFFINTLYLVLDSFQSEEQYSGLMKSIKTLRPKVEGEGLRIYVDKINFYEKSHAWKLSINNKISALQKKFSNEIANELRYTLEKDWSIETKKFSKKLKDLKERLGDAWIDKNLMYEKVKYPEMEYFELLYSTIKPKVSGSRFIRSYAKNQIVRKVWLMIVTSLATVAITVITITQFNDLRNLIFDLTIVFALLLLNVLSGVFSAHSAHKSRVVDTADRLQIMLNYEKGETNGTKELPPENIYEEELEILEAIEIPKPITV